MPSTTDDPTTPAPTFPRRHVLAGLGALGGGAMFTGFPDAAAAEPGAADGTGAGGPGRRATTITSTIASAPQTGVHYEFRDQFAFVAENGTPLHWTVAGVRPSGVATTLWTAFDLPPGATVYDIEWYLSNTGPTIYPSASIWEAGTTRLSTRIAAGSAPSGAGVRAVRTLADSAANGPFPHGCKLLVGVPTRADNTVTVNGARVGFRSGASATHLLPDPVRVYDSRTTGGPCAPNETRTISISSAIPAGATGAVLALSVTGCQGRGTLRLGRGGAVPTATAIQWARTGDQVTTAANTAVNSSRQITLRSVGSTGTTHIVVDVVGYLT